VFRGGYKGYIGAYRIFNVVVVFLEVSTIDLYTSSIQRGLEVFTE